jgi:HEAT repeat protein
MFPKPEAELQVLLNELMECLGKKPGFMTRSPVPEVLRRIGQHGDPAALPWLFDLIHSSTETIRSASEKAVEQLLPKLDAQQIIELELFIRSSWTRFYSDDHSYRAKTEHGARLATLHSSGWIREKAIIALMESGDAGALPFVLLRSNDWVEQVRRAADQWFSVHGAAVPVDQLAASLPILAALTERVHGRASSIVTKLLARLTLPSAATVHMKWLPRANARTRKLLFTLLGQSGALQDTDTQSVLLKNPDPIFGVLLLKHLRGQSPEVPPEILEQALSAKSATLRRYALHSLSEDQISQIVPLLSQAMFDSAQGVRSFAQYHLLKRLSAKDLRSRYTGVLENPHVRNARFAACILGYHEIGGRWAASQYLELAHHDSMKVRAAVLRTFAATHFEEALPWLKVAFASHYASSLAKAAMAVFRKQPQAWTMTEIKSLLGEEHAAEVRQRAFVLLCRRGKWEQLPVLLDLLSDSCGGFEHQVLSQLWAWRSRYNQTQSQPTRVQIELALAALDRVRERLDSRLSSEFHALLSSVVVRGA